MGISFGLRQGCTGGRRFLFNCDLVDVADGLLLLVVALIIDDTIVAVISVSTVGCLSLLVDDGDDSLFVILREILTCAANQSSLIKYQSHSAFSRHSLTLSYGVVITSCCNNNTFACSINRTVPASFYFPGGVAFHQLFPCPVPRPGCIECRHCGLLDGFILKQSTQTFRGIGLGGRPDLSLFCDQVHIT